MSLILLRILKGLYYLGFVLICILIISNWEEPYNVEGDIGLFLLSLPTFPLGIIAISGIDWLLRESVSKSNFHFLMRPQSWYQLFYVITAWTLGYYQWCVWIPKSLAAIFVFFKYGIRECMTKTLDDVTEKYWTAWSLGGIFLGFLAVTSAYMLI